MQRVIHLGLNLGLVLKHTVCFETLLLAFVLVADSRETCGRLGPQLYITADKELCDVLPSIMQQEVRISAPEV
jgi:hypothetical protein